MADLVAEAAERTVPDTMRETVAAVATLTATADATPATAIATELHLDKSAALRRVRVAMARGYLRNLEEKRGRQARIVLGDALPEEQVVLPEVERLQGCNAVPGDTHHGSESVPVAPKNGALPPVSRNGTSTVQPPPEESEEELLDQLHVLDGGPT